MSKESDRLIARACRPTTPSDKKTAAEMLQELGMKLSTQEIKERIAAKRLDANMQIIRSSMSCLHDVYDEFFAAPTSTEKGASK